MTKGSSKEIAMEGKQLTCSGVVQFGATAGNVHPCDVDVFDDYTDCLRVRIEAKDRERDVPVYLELEREEALRLLKRLAEVLQPQQDCADN